MIENSTIQTQLCPYCANSIGEDATKCSYCKADLRSEHVPRWLNRDETSTAPRTRSANDKKRFSMRSKFIWPVTLFVVASAAFLVGGHMQRNRLLHVSEADSKRLEAKDQMIQSQEAQLTQLRQQLHDSSDQLVGVKTKLEESQKELSAMRQRLGVTTRELDRLNASRSVAAKRTASPSSGRSSSLPSQASTRRPGAPGVYETIQDTSVRENPSSTSRVVSQLGRGTRINVVGAAGEWLEVRSRYGNPPGYVRSADVRPIGQAN
jgi:hypothetical protein